jgi:carbamoyltransferase
MHDRYALGIHLGHDRSVSLVKNGKLIGHVSQERIDRIKHSHSAEIPYVAIDKLLQYLRVKMVDIACVGITYVHIEIEKIQSILKEEFIERYGIKKDIGFWGVSHHQAHAESAFHMSGFNESSILIADGAGDFVGDKLESETIFFGNQDKVSLVERRLQDALFSNVTHKNFYIYPYLHEFDAHKQISLGRKYEQLTYLLGFGWGQAGKTMGLAPYGKPLLKLDHLHVEGINFDLTLESILRELFYLQQESNKTFYKYIQQEKANIAKTAQVFIETYAIELTKYISRKYQADNLCLAGGVFLNCVLNHKILVKSGIRNVFILPAAGDDGQSIGAAIAAYKKGYKGELMPIAHFSPFLGFNYTDNSILKCLKTKNVKFEKWLPRI